MSLIAIDLRGLPKNRYDLAVRYASGLGEQLARAHNLLVVYRHPYQLDLVPSLANLATPIRVSTNLTLVNNRTLNKLGVKLIYCPTRHFKRWGAKFHVITTDLTDFSTAKAVADGSRVFDSDQVVVGSVAQSKRLVERNLTKTQPTTIHPATNLEVENSPLRSEPVSRTIVYGGDWLPEKNAPYLAEAFGVLGDFELVVTRPLNASNIRKIKGLFASQNARVRFEQLNSPERLQRLITEAFAVFQTNIPDSLGLVPADLMALGTPVLVADQPVMQELVGATGTFVDPKDPLSFALKVRELQRLGAWARAAEYSRRKAEQQTWAIASQKLERLIQQLLN